jgi:8-oxo-dGTP diphosphatase
MNMYSFKCVAKSKDFKMNVHHDFRWLEKERLMELDWAEADKPIVNKILEN